MEFDVNAGEKTIKAWVSESVARDKDARRALLDAIVAKAAVPGALPKQATVSSGDPAGGRVPFLITLPFIEVVPRGA